MTMPLAMVVIIVAVLMSGALNNGKLSKPSEECRRTGGY